MTSAGDLAGRVAIVTGAGQGIGRGIAELFAAQGCRVLVAARREDGARGTADAIRAAGGVAEPIAADLETAIACEQIVEAAIRTFGALHILVHNAGIFPHAPIADLHEEQLDEVLAVNLKAAFRLARTALPHLAAGGDGRLLFTSSVTGPRVAMPGYAAYAASKAGLDGFIRTAALEYAAHGITVNGVAPGFVLTPSTDAFPTEDAAKAMQRTIPIRRFGRPDDVAHAMLFLAGPHAGYVTGQTIVVDGGSTLPENQQAFARLNR